MSQQGKLSEPPSDLETLTGNTGGAVGPDGAGNINVVGSDPLTVTGNPAANTLTISPGDGGYPITPYVVGPVGEAGYQTIQDALDAANAAGGGIVYIQPGSYTEDLILYDQTQLITGGFSDAYGSVTITGTHTPPSSGGFVFRNIRLVSSTDILNSMTAGSAHIVMADAEINVTNGYTFNLPNWTGIIEMWDVNEAALSTNNGCINNTGGAQILCFSGSFGQGNVNSMTISGSMFTDGAEFFCPVNFQSGSNIGIEHSNFYNAVTASSNATGDITTCIFNTGSNAAFTMSSSGNIFISNCSFTSSNDPVIAGGGAGTLTLLNNSFVSNSNISSSLNLASSIIKGGNFITDYVVSPDGTAPYTTIQDALDAANSVGTPAQIIVRPGTYTEDLTFYDGIQLTGSSEQNTFINGTHTPPTSGTLNLFRCTFQDSSAILFSAAAGTSTIIIEDCSFVVTNGFSLDLDNWTGAIGLFDIGNGGTNDGGINNSGGAFVFMFASGLGNGNGQTMVLSGPLLITTSDFDCPIDFQTGATGTLANCYFTQGVTFSNNSSLEITNSSWMGLSGAAITMSSSASNIISNCAIETSNNPAIDGAGAGTLTLAAISFLDNSNLAATLTLGNSNFYPTAMTDGQLLIGDTGGTAAPANLTSTDGSVTIANGANSIDLSVVGGGLVWSVETGTTANLVENTGVIGNNAAGVTFTLPATATVGDTFAVTGLQASWTVAQNAGQTIHMGDQSSTTGAGGSLASTAARDVITFICVVDNTDFQVLSSIGNITVT